MADPLSTAASLAGLVSLGLQVYGGVSTYVDSIQGRNEDLESARQSAKSLGATVRFIKQIIPQLQANHQTHSAIILQCVQLCQNQLASLQNLLHELESSSASGGSFRDNIRDRRKKLTYPFHRSNLDRLESRLGKANGSLQTALQVLDMRGQQVTNTMLAGIENLTRDTPAELHRMSSEIAATSSTLRGVDNALSPMRDSVAALGPLLTSKADETNTQLARMESSIVSSMLLQQAMLANAVSAADQRNAAHERNINSLRDLLLRRLVSVPSALKELSDELVPSQIAMQRKNASITRRGRYQDPDSSLITSQSDCLCRVRTTYQGKQSQLGSLRFYNQQLVEERHFPGCPRRAFIMNRSKQTYGVTYAGLVSVMNRAIDLSFSTCFGAGGWSIAKFRCISTVDERKAPVFRLMKSLASATYHSTDGFMLEYMKNRAITTPELEDLLNSVLVKIRWLFDNRLGCPDDVNATNQTVMVGVLDVVAGISYTRISGRSDLTEVILDNVMRLLEIVRYYDVPVLSYDNRGRTPFLALQPTFVEDPSWIAFVIDTVISPTSEILPFSSHQLEKRNIVHKSVHGMVSGFGVSQTYAECWGCGPLSLAIIAGDIDQVGHILQKHPTLLKEVNLFRQTPFHLAAGNPACLSLLLQTLQPADHALLDHEDAEGNSALVYALAFSLKRCRSDSSKEKCRRCTCASSLVMLLNTNACSLPRKSMLLGFFNISASLRCKIKLINHVKRQGEILREVALDSPFWTNADTEACNLHGTDVLDAYASLVVNILKTHGVRMAHSFESPWFGDCASVYHYVWDTADAEEFYRRGFRDVAVPNNDGFVPLDVAHLPPSYLSWLVEHGAPLNPALQRSTRMTLEDSLCGKIHGKKLDVSQNKTHIHGISFSTGHFFTYRLAEFRDTTDFDREQSSIKLLSTSIVPADIVDDCECPCSDRGCIPWTDMMKGLCGATEYQDREVNPVHTLAARFSDFLGMSHELLGPSQLKASIRFLTFSGLGMTHVCCWPCFDAWEMRSGFHRSFPSGEAREIRELESKELHTLEGLVTEFYERLNLQSSVFSADLTVLNDFWNRHWVSRMEEVLEDLKGVADYEIDIKGAEEIGVVWEKADDENEAELAGYAYWANEIDKIMEDARGLLKARND